MIPVFQTLTLHNDGTGNCFNACVASLLERPLNQVASILPDDPGVWFLNWKKWLAGEGYDLTMVEAGFPPMGYALLSYDTDRLFPDNHPKAGEYIPHVCVVYDGQIVHDPYPIKNHGWLSRLHHYYLITPIKQ